MSACILDITRKVVVLLCAGGLLLGGCGQSTLDKAAAVKDKACACTDAECFNSVRDEIRTIAREAKTMPDVGRRTSLTGRWRNDKSKVNRLLLEAGSCGLKFVDPSFLDPPPTGSRSSHCTEQSE